MPTITLSDIELAEVIRGLRSLARHNEQDAANCQSISVRTTFETNARFCNELAERLKTYRQEPVIPAPRRRG